MNRTSTHPLAPSFSKGGSFGFRVLSHFRIARFPSRLSRGNQAGVDQRGWSRRLDVPGFARS